MFDLNFLLFCLFTPFIVIGMFIFATLILLFWICVFYVIYWIWKETVSLFKKHGK